MNKHTLRLTLLLAVTGIAAMAQQPPPDGPQGPPPPAGRGGRGGSQMLPPPGPPPLERALLPGPHGKWWDDPETSQRLSLTADQRKRMDDVFQQFRLKLIDLHAAVQREDATMEPLVAADQPDENKIVAQIDKVAQARAELEKANARMLLAIRRVLTNEQFQKLQSQRPADPVQPGPPPPRKK
jgi:Spy/CpxP family protein refolding chaperone